MACLRSTGHAPCLAERLAPTGRRRRSRIDRILASRRVQEGDYLGIPLTRPLPAGKLPHGQPTKEYTLCCSTRVRERSVMSDTTGEIAALSDKMGAAVRHRFKQTIERWGKKGITDRDLMYLSPILRMGCGEQELEKKMLNAANWLTCVCFLIRASPFSMLSQELLQRGVVSVYHVH